MDWYKVGMGGKRKGGGGGLGEGYVCSLWSSQEEPRLSLGSSAPVLGFSNQPRAYSHNGFGIAENAVLG